MRETVEKAIVAGANLRDANLRGANLRGANLAGANLRGANLRDANLRGANLRDANLRDANLRGADLAGANLRGANLAGADLAGAHLAGANLRGVDLAGVDLRDANLRGADLRGAQGITPLFLAQLSIIPDTGDFVGWKKCTGSVIVKLCIPAKAKRSNAHGRKCRAEFVRVLQVISPSGDVKTGVSSYDESVIYEKGKTVKCDKWNDDRWTECGGGIHFFITRIEAENYSL